MKRVRYFWKINQTEMANTWRITGHYGIYINGVNYLWRCRVTSHRKRSASSIFKIDIFRPFLSLFFFCFEGLENRRFTADFMETKKTKKKKQIFFFARWIGGTNEFLSGKIASFIGGELRSWTGLETEKYWILRY